MVAILPLMLNGIAYGMLLFIMAIGLSITMGMMHFVNLAQVSFSMIGGYVMVTAMEALGLPFAGALLASFALTALFAALLERVVFRYFYAADDLTQVLLTIGLVFMSVAAAAFIWGVGDLPVQLPRLLVGNVEIWNVSIERYRLFLVAVGALLVIGLELGLNHTGVGATIRACVDNRRAAEGSGLNSGLIFAATFAVGGGLAGMGGALSIHLLGLDPNFPLRYLVYVLIVVSVGGLGTITGTLSAALAIGITDIFGKYYLPEIGGFIIYIVTFGLLMWRPQGLLGRHS